MSKYYTPEIEEFHIGFEYEQEDINEGGSSISWYKYTIKEGEAYIIDQLITNEDLGLSYRVKYLNKEDIESLGFKQSETDPYWYDYKNDRYWLYKEDENDWRWIIEDDQSEISFAGTIKNKSELKKLMKQLNINE